MFFFICGVCFAIGVTNVVVPSNLPNPILSPQVYWYLMIGGGVGVVADLTIDWIKKVRAFSSSSSDE